MGGLLAGTVPTRELLDLKRQRRRRLAAAISRLADVQ